jgi:sulfite reductase (NADPH) flavoprotein alpha-component
MTTQAPFTSLLPVTPEQLGPLQAAIEQFSPTQLAWLSGYFWGLVNQPSVGTVAAPHAPQGLPETSSLANVSTTIISASQTGNALRVAQGLRDALQEAQLPVTLVSAGDYKTKQLAQEKQLIIVASTQGDGEPAEEAQALFKFLKSKKAPKLSDCAFAVFGLGDSSYQNFCQSGKDFDQRLAELGATRLLARVDGDVEYQAQAAQWRSEVVALLKQRQPASTATTVATASTHAESEVVRYSREQPCDALLSVNQKITGRGSQKDVRHLEIDLGDSGLRYQPGDALGVWYENDPQLVKELLELLWLKGDETVSVNGQRLSLTDALLRHFELTQNSTSIVTQYAALSRNDALLALLADKPALQQYLQVTPLVDMVRQAPCQLEADQLLALLRPLAPRLYSIASSQAETENEVHITVGVVRYEVDGRVRTGGASGYLADRLPIDGNVRVFVEPNNHFRLPADGQTPVIMIGPGTGIAPFRAFMQQREVQGDSGKNWLFFGNPHFTEDFLYQVEWQRYVKEGLLTRIDLAWSRDQAQKIYVQDKVRQQGAELWQWLQQGAHIYVCGDAGRMAKDVEKALLEVIAQHGGLDADAADEYLTELREARRYQRDVY